MAKTKKKTAVKKTPKTAAGKVSAGAKTTTLSNEARRTQNWFEELKLSESYVSLLLGAVVVVVLSAVFFIFIKSGALNGSEFSNTKPLTTQTSLQNPRTYTLKEGEGLWDVAVKYFGDGYRWVEIAKANNLTEEQANKLGPGSKIIIPELR